MASVKVKFRDSTVGESEGRIYYQIIHRRKVRQLRTDFRIYNSEWDETAMTVVTVGDIGRYSYIKEVRNRVRYDLEQFHSIISRLEKKPEYTAEDVVEEFLRKTTEGSMFRYMEQIISGLRINGRVRTSETYKAAFNSFWKFRDGRDMKFDCLTEGIMEEYEGWLRQGGKCLNTISFYMRILRAVYKRAVKDGLTEDRTIFSKVYTGVEKTVKRALPIKKIRKIMVVDLSKRWDLAYARDMFILSFMLRGMSFVDMANLRKNDLSNGILSYRRRKTGQLLSIRWTDEMQGIVDRYPGRDCQYLLPILGNPEALPFYATRNAAYRINKALGEIGEIVGAGIPLTMYVARHSWASAAKSKGVPVGLISEGLGHDSEKTTQIYLAELDGKAVDKVNRMLLKELA